MFRNFKTVDHIVFGRGSFNQLDDILVSRRTANRSAMVFVVDDAFAEAPLRERVPLISIDGRLAAVGDLCLCEPFQAEEGESSVMLHWERGDGTGTMRGISV